MPDLGAQPRPIEQGRLVDALNVGECPNVGLDQRLTLAGNVLHEDLQIERLGLGETAQLEDAALDPLLGNSRRKDLRVG